LYDSPGCGAWTARGIAEVFERRECSRREIGGCKYGKSPNSVSSDTTYSIQARALRGGTTHLDCPLDDNIANVLRDGLEGRHLL
jgi:hypothetical protein